METGAITKSQAWAHTLGQMEKFTQDNGFKTTCTGKECSLGQMVVGMRASMSTTKSMASAFTHGPITVNMLVSGRTGSNTDKASTRMLTELKELGSGKKANE
jgi:hypothetical protein